MEAKTYFKNHVKRYRIERNVSGEAFESADIFINWFAQRTSPEILAVALKGRAKMFLTMQSPADALKDLNEAKKLTANKVGIYKQIALAYTQMASMHLQKVLDS